jgi:hypothetical protein
VVVGPIEENKKITIRKHKLTGLLRQKIRSKTKQNSFDFCNFTREVIVGLVLKFLQ